MDQAAVGATEARSDCRVEEREKELRREKLDLPGRENCPNKSGARAGDSVRDEPG